MSLIEMKVENGVATVLLNRPEKLNAFFGSMREDLAAALDECSGRQDTRVVVVTGAGRGFCSGGDVARMRELQAEQATEEFKRLLEAGRRIVTAIREMPQLVIAAINGVAAGAGCNLALACDYRMASETAQLGETFVRIGLHPDWGGSYFLPRLVGPSRAMEIMMTGRMVSAAEALEIGMVDRVVKPEMLEGETMKLAATIAAGPPLAITAIKRAVYASPVNSLSDQIDLENDIQLTTFRSADSAEGMASLFEKRSPRFKGV
ncbi:MAG TPA: enoyl-CoA hydratase-related protein [Thermoanaerobaculia bacterium]|nr:enoyl-CoA hydratase-related protein [Thermoanaerobaculia bacterium]